MFGINGPLLLLGHTIVFGDQNVYTQISVENELALNLRVVIIYLYACLGDEYDNYIQKYNDNPSPPHKDYSSGVKIKLRD